MNALLTIGAAGCLAACALPSYASPPSGNSLIEDCKVHSRAPDTIPATRCAVYIQGFIDGTRAAEVLKARNKRMLSTPFGSRVTKDPSARRLQYCLAPDVSVTEIIRNILRHVGKSSNLDAPAQELLHELFRLHYPCNQQSSARERN
jgi:hypothetical protein